MCCRSEQLFFKCLRAFYSLWAVVLSIFLLSCLSFSSQFLRDLKKNRISPSSLIQVIVSFRLCLWCFFCFFFFLLCSSFLLFLWSCISQCFKTLDFRAVVGKIFFTPELRRQSPMFYSSAGETLLFVSESSMLLLSYGCDVLICEVLGFTFA